MIFSFDWLLIFAHVEHPFNTYRQVTNSTPNCTGRLFSKGICSRFITGRLRRLRRRRRRRSNSSRRVNLRALMTRASHRIARAADTSRADRYHMKGRYGHHRHGHYVSTQSNFQRRHVSSSLLNHHTRHLNHFSSTTVSFTRHNFRRAPRRQHNTRRR